MSLTPVEREQLSSSYWMRHSSSVELANSSFGPASKTAAANHAAESLAFERLPDRTNWEIRTTSTGTSVKRTVNLEDLRDALERKGITTDELAAGEVLARARSLDFTYAFDLSDETVFPSRDKAPEKSRGPQNSLRERERARTPGRKKRYAPEPRFPRRRSVHLDSTAAAAPVMEAVTDAEEASAALKSAAMGTMPEYGAIRKGRASSSARSALSGAPKIDNREGRDDPRDAENLNGFAGNPSLRIFRENYFSERRAAA